jgi:hypothetical protein
MNEQNAAIANFLNSLAVSANQPQGRIRRDLSGNVIDQTPQQQTSAFPGLDAYQKDMQGFNVDARRAALDPYQGQVSSQPDPSGDVFNGLFQQMLGQQGITSPAGPAQSPVMNQPQGQPQAQPAPAPQAAPNNPTHFPNYTEQSAAPAPPTAPAPPIQQTAPQPQPQSVQPQPAQANTGPPPTLGADLGRPDPANPTMSGGPGENPDLITPVANLLSELFPTTLAPAKPMGPAEASLGDVGYTNPVFKVLNSFFNSLPGIHPAPSETAPDVARRPDFSGFNQPQTPAQPQPQPEAAPLNPTHFSNYNEQPQPQPSAQVQQTPSVASPAPTPQVNPINEQIPALAALYPLLSQLEAFSGAGFPQPQATIQRQATDISQEPVQGPQEPSLGDPGYTNPLFDFLSNMFNALPDIQQSGVPPIAR